MHAENVLSPHSASALTAEESFVSTCGAEGAMNQQVDIVHSCIQPGSIPRKFHVYTCHYMNCPGLLTVISVPVPVAEATSIASCQGPTVCQSFQHAQGRQTPAALS